MGEFDLIKRYFTSHKRSDCSDILQSIGDDCAVINIPNNEQLAITTDTLVKGTHFLPSISAANLAYKTVAVNLSDLAAMGATPRWVSLALTLEKVDHRWLTDFSQTLLGTLAHYGVTLIGGDTTKGLLSLTLTAQGTLPKGQGLFRHKAKVGDWIFVSGYLGDSAAGLSLLLNAINNRNTTQEYLIQRHLCPTPRVALGKLLLEFSQCAIDISDGFLADLSHILTRSQCGAEIWLEKLPLSPALRTQYTLAEAEQFALVGGEDYELCFTIPETQRTAFERTVANLAIPVHCVGKITPNHLTLLKYGQPQPLPKQIGFDHFA